MNLHDFNPFYAVWADWRPAHPNWVILAEIILLVAAFVPLRKRVVRRSRLREKEYFRPFLLPLLARNGTRLTLVFFAAGPLLLGWRALDWPTLAAGPAFKIFILACAAPLAWNFATHGFNFYYGRSHAWDRLAIVVLAGLIFAHPGFAPPLLLLVLAMIHQLGYPIPRTYRWTDKIPLVEILILFQVYLWLRLLAAPVSNAAFAIVAFSILGSSYLYSGLKKMELQWMKSERLDWLFANACDNGWLRFLGCDRQKRIAGALNRAGWPLKIMTLALEAGVIVALAHPWVATVFCLGLFGLHLGIFFFSGILFWMWMALDLAFIPLIFEVWTELAGFGAHPLLPLIASAVLMIAGTRFWSVKRLAWVDSPLSGVFRFDVVLADGSVREAPPCQLEPYDFPMTQGRFHYLRQEASTAERGAEQEFKPITVGVGAKGKDYSAKFEKFIRGFFANHNRIGCKRSRAARGLMAPWHVWSAPISDAAWDGRGQVIAVRVRYTETMFDERGWTVVGDTLVKEIKIDK